MAGLCPWIAAAPSWGQRGQTAIPGSGVAAGYISAERTRAYSVVGLFIPEDQASCRFGKAHHYEGLEDVFPRPRARRKGFVRHSPPETRTEFVSLQECLDEIGLPWRCRSTQRALSRTSLKESISFSTSFIRSFKDRHEALPQGMLITPMPEPIRFGP
jgi:hypothetical protein